MRRLKYILIIIWFYNSGLLGAQDQTFSQFFLNPTDINPALTGVESYLDVSIGHKQLWRDFDTGDNSSFLSIDKAFGQTPSSVYKNNSLRVRNIDRFKSIDQDKRLKRKHGLGISLRSDNTGALQMFNASLRYSYHLPLTLKWRLSFGTALRYQQSNIEFEKYTVRDDSDAFIQSLMASGGNENSYLVDFGASVYSTNLLISISAQGLVNEGLDEGLIEVNRERVYNGFINHNTAISRILDINNSLLTSYNELGGLYWVVSTRFRYKDRVTLGAGYDSNDRLSGFLGLRVQDSIYLNYTYDYFVGTLSSFNVVNHEFILNFKLSNPYKFKERLW